MGLAQEFHLKEVPAPPVPRSHIVGLNVLRYILVPASLSLSLILAFHHTSKLMLLIKTLPATFGMWHFCYIVRASQSRDRRSRFMVDDETLTQFLVVDGRASVVRRVEWRAVSSVAESESGILFQPEEGAPFLIPNGCFESSTSKCAFLRRVECFIDLTLPLSEASVV